MASNTDEIYILDTNILVAAAKYNYLKTYDINNSELKQYGWKLKKAVDFINTNASKIRILDVVWAEFLGFYLQKEIDYKNYQTWYHRRFDAITKTFKDLLTNNITFVSIKERKSYIDLFKITQDLTQTPLEIGLVEDIDAKMDKTINDLLRQIENEKNKSIKNDRNIEKWTKIIERKRNPRNKKVFDGLDGIIAAYSAIYAKQNQQKEVTLITDDKNLEIVISYYNLIKKEINQSFDWPVNCKAQPLVNFNKKASNQKLSNATPKLRRLEKKQYN